MVFRSIFLIQYVLLSISIVAATSTTYDVVIIGAGPAGIAAAIDLKKYKPNISMKILEARNRIGGRVFTDTTTFKYGAYADIGAEWIHAYGPKNPLYYWHRRLQTPIEKQEDDIFDFFTPSLTGCYDVSGEEVSRSTCLEAQQVMEKLFKPAYNKTLQTLDTSVRNYIQSAYDKIPAGIVKRLVDSMMIGREEIEAADLDQVSALQNFFGDSPGDDEEEAGEDMALIHGYGNLINRIAQFNNLTADLNTVVTNINTVNQNFVEIKTNDNRMFRSKTVLITVPLGCLKNHSITFEPSLPQWKLDAIKAIGFGNTEKIILQFDRVFWNSKFTTFYMAGSPYPFAVCEPDKRILVFLVAGKLARYTEATDDETTVAIIMKNLKLAFPQEKFSLLASRKTRWSQDPYARGSWSYYTVNSTVAMHDTLGRQCCQNRLFWAGEHTTTGGSVHNAFATGQREAINIFQRLN